MAKLVPIPTLTVLPPSSDTESWSHSPSPRPHRPHRTHRTGGKDKRRTHAQENPSEPGAQEQNPPEWNEAEEKKSRRRSLSPRILKRKHKVEEAGAEGQEGRFSPLLLHPSRSRWSLRSLLSKDSDWDSSCSTASNSPRSTPGSSPSLRRRMLGGRGSEGEGPADRSAGGGSESPQPTTPSSTSS